MERDLLRTWPVRRLAFVAFAGASAVSSTLNLPLVDGRPLGAPPPAFAHLPPTPVTFAVRRPAAGS